MSPLPVDLGDGGALRRLTLSDLESVWAVVVEDRDRLAVWMPWAAATETIDDQRRWLEGVLADERSLDGVGIFHAGAYAGGIGLMIGPFGVVGEIGYWIGSRFEGRGLVTRAVRAMIEIGFRDLGLHRIEIQAGVHNARSRAIPERLGFRQEGTRRGAERGSGGYYDLVVYGLLADEWPAA